MGELHVVLTPPGAREFVERYAEHLRRPRFPTNQSPLIFWWSPDKPFCRTLGNPHLRQSEEPDDAYWPDLQKGTLPQGTTVVVLDNDLLLHGTVAKQRRDKINTVAHVAQASPYTLVLMFVTDKPPSTWLLHFQDLVIIAHVVLAAHNEHHGRYLKDRDGLSLEDVITL